MRRRQTRGKKEPGLKVIPIGGLNEIGKNMTLLEYNNQILIIDCGMTFPEDEMYGIDIVIPDFSYVIENRDKLVGMVITFKKCKVTYIRNEAHSRPCGK